MANRLELGRKRKMKDFKKGWCQRFVYEQMHCYERGAAKKIVQMVCWWCEARGRDGCL